MKYSQHERSQVVMTAWAILSLIYARYPDKSAIDQGVKLIMSRQQRDGRWEAEDIEGVFNKNCAIYYPGLFIPSSRRFPLIGAQPSNLSFASGL